jgi:hypothetical protein
MSDEATIKESVELIKKYPFLKWNEKLTKELKKIINNKGK